jgi:hypothetical protein
VRVVVLLLLRLLLCLCLLFRYSSFGNLSRFERKRLFKVSRVFVAVLSFCFRSKSLSRMRAGKTKRRALLLSI